MNLPEVDKVRLQKVVSECESTFEPSDFDELCDAVSETTWASKLELDAKVIGELIRHHSVKTTVKVGEVQSSPTLPPPARKKPEPKAEIQSEVVEKKCFDEPGRGRKQCLACNKYVGVRNPACTNCGNVFPVKVVAPKPVPPKPAPKPVAIPKPISQEVLEVASQPLYKAPVRPVSVPMSTGFHRQFVHGKGEVWEIAVDVLWRVDPKTHEPLNEHRYKWKICPEWNAAFLFNVKTDTPYWKEEGHRRPPHLPETWKTVAEISEGLKHETIAATNS